MQRSELKHDLLTIFSALNGLQYRYDWIISNADLYLKPDTPQEIKLRWQYTGILMDGLELTRHLEAGYVHFCLGVILSAVPKGTKANAIWDYLPCWEIENFGDPNDSFQTPLTELEMFCYDGYAFVIICPPSFSKTVLQALPTVKTVDEFYQDNK